MNIVAAIQMCSSDQVDDNLAIAAKLIKESVQNGANLVVLPEMFPIIGLYPTDKLLVKETMGHGKIQSFLSQQAKIHDVWIVGGTIPITSENKNQIKAACLVLNNEGCIVARYDKIHLFDAYISDSETYQESSITMPGNKLVVVDTPLGKLGLTVCYDIRFPELYRYLVNCGAQIITVPAAFTLKTGQAHWEILARSRAIENSCYIIGACQGGHHANGRDTYGHSLIVDAWGSLISEKTKIAPGIIYAKVDLNYLKQIRKSIPTIKQQKILFDISKLKACSKRELNKKFF